MKLLLVAASVAAGTFHISWRIFYTNLIHCDMNKLNGLSSALFKLGFKEESHRIIILARESDLVYQTIAANLISDLEDKIRSGDIALSESKEYLLRVHADVEVDLSGISNYSLNHIAIMIEVANPKLESSNPDADFIRTKFEGNGGYFRKKEAIPLATAFSFKMDNGELVGVIKLFPSYSVFKKLSGMTKIEALRELFFGDLYFNQMTLRSLIAHELTHIIDWERVGGKFPKESSYADSKIEINARIQEILFKLFNEELGINIETGEGWGEIGKRWSESKDWDIYIDFSLMVYTWVNDGAAEKFIDGIIKRWGPTLHINSVSEDTRKRYIKRLYEIWEVLRRFHAATAPSLPVTPMKAKVLSKAIPMSHKVEFKDPLKSIFRL